MIPAVAGHGAQGMQGIGGQRRTFSASTFKHDTPRSNAR